MQILIFGTVEIGLSDGDNYQQLDLLGKGSVIGIYGAITGSEWDYTAKVKSKRAIIMEIDS